MRPAHRPPRVHNGRPSQTSDVPSWSRVTPGTPVSIVLKADQPTGRQVQGTVQDVLTRHDHPRGVKVRLTDGRVGRVQRLVDGAAPIDNGEMQTIVSGPPSNQPMKYRDIRLDEELEAPPATNDLAAYIKPAKQKKRKGAPAQPTVDAPVEQKPDAECPVCHDFRGDEAAVAFHVEEHFK